jgi:hypothetical protein
VKARKKTRQRNVVGSLSRSLGIGPTPAQSSTGVQGASVLAHALRPEAFRSCMRILITRSEGLEHPTPRAARAEGGKKDPTSPARSRVQARGSVGRQWEEEWRGRRAKGAQIATTITITMTMTNPPSAASQGSGGTQSYPKSILKKSVQAAFEGERDHQPFPSPQLTTTHHHRRHYHRHHHHHHHHQSVPVCALCVSVCRVFWSLPAIWRR